MITRLNTEMSSNWLKCAYKEVVPIMSNLLVILLGYFLIRTNNVYNTLLLNLGPYEIYSTSLSRLSIMMQAKGDL